MSRKINSLFGTVEEVNHLYDFGTTSETKVKSVDMRQGSPLTQYPIVLMARNQMPQESCQECDKQAGWLCMECIYEEEKLGLLCEKHVTDHPHEDYDTPIELVNSPRMGMCAYGGPAEPPY